MRERDFEILYSLKNFRVLNRDQLISIHFNDQKQPITTCNRVMNRLALQGLIRVDKTRRPFNYFHGESNMKFNSMKQPHFSMIADLYIDMCKYMKPDKFEVEPKVGEKGTVESDVFTIWNGVHFLIEVQRSIFTKKVMKAKINRYQEYYNSNTWKNPQSLSNHFPVVIIFTEYDYEIESDGIKFLQAKDVDDLVKKYMS